MEHFKYVLLNHFVFCLLKEILPLIIHVHTIGNALELSSQVPVNMVCVYVTQDTFRLTTTAIKVNKLVSIFFLTSINTVTTR